jgi:hypothetical protein
MFVEAGFPSEEGKWNWDSGTVEGGWVSVAFIGPEHRVDVEAERWFSGRQWWMLQCISYGSVAESGGGETEGRVVVRRGRGGGELVLTMMLHGVVLRGWPTCVV